MYAIIGKAGRGRKTERQGLPMLANEHTPVCMIRCYVDLNCHLSPPRASALIIGWAWWLAPGPRVHMVPQGMLHNSDRHGNPQAQMSYNPPWSAADHNHSFCLGTLGNTSWDLTFKGSCIWAELSQVSPLASIQTPLTPAVLQCMVSAM